MLPPQTCSDLLTGGVLYRKSCYLAEQHLGDRLPTRQVKRTQNFQSERAIKGKADLKLLFVILW